MQRRLSGGYQLDDDPDRLDREAVIAFLTTEAYWGRWRGAEDIVRQLDSAWRCIGLYTPDGAQVGFARVVSDGVSLGYLADVYVLAAHRSKGLGLAIVREAVDSQPTWRWMLHTADAHELYAKLGFQPAPATYLERPRP
ncbi:GNAT family N-acetyltransferase [Jatrophihabitans sp.]|jgi:GNAT superfamily N-acetyltransferase|uniref:GNAT family N-acetyltransferase n=1 Tax=Jatrophihabitans sp. TaxID=1932789 RepID=UPI002EF20942